MKGLKFNLMLEKLKETVFRANLDLVDHGLLLDLQARVDHPLHGGVHRGPLHPHEVGQGVVDVEDDGFDHGKPIL